jgi:nucleotide-binding universal stress UspA family protein
VTVAVAQDDSAEGRAALLHAAREAAFRHTRLAVLHVVAGDGTDASATAAADDVVEALTEAGLQSLEWSRHTASDEDGTAEALVHLTELVGADLLVIGSRRRTPIGKFLLGSTVQRVLLDSPVPVLVVKASRGTSRPAAGRR